MLPLLRTLGPLLLIALGLAACGGEIAEPRPLPATPAAPRPALTDDPGPPIASAKPAAPPAKTAPSLMVEQVQGADAARARAIFAPIRSSLKECNAGTSGALVVNFKRSNDETQMQIAPGGPALDAKARRCALETLSTVDTDGVFERNAPADRPSNFSAQLRIQW